MAASFTKWSWLQDIVKAEMCTGCIIFLLNYCKITIIEIKINFPEIPLIGNFAHIHRYVYINTGD